MTPESPGWYDDPDDPAYLRYFDGVEWSGRREPKEMPERRSGAQDPYAPAAPQRSGDPYATAGGPGGSDHPSWPQGGPGRPPGQPSQGWQLPPPPPGQPSQGWQTPPPAWQPGPAPYGYGPPTIHGRLLAGWGARLGAYLLDSFLMSIVMGLVTLPLSLPFYRALVEWFRSAIHQSVQAGAAGTDPVLADPPVPGTTFYLASLVAALGYVVYDTVCTRRWGRTLGKRVVGLRVLDVTRPELPTAGAALRRSLVKYVSSLLGAVPFVGGIASAFELVDGLFPLWDKPFRQALHDKAGGTVVVRDRA